MKGKRIREYYLKAEKMRTTKGKGNKSEYFLVDEREKQYDEGKREERKWETVSRRMK